MAAGAAAATVKENDMGNFLPHQARSEISIMILWILRVHVDRIWLGREWRREGEARLPRNPHFIEPWEQYFAKLLS